MRWMATSDNKQIVKIQQQTIISSADSLRVSIMDIDRFTKEKISKDVADFLLDHIHTLPINYTSKYSEVGSDGSRDMIYKIKFNLISDCELSRLLEIERLYNKYRPREMEEAAETGIDPSTSIHELGFSTRALNCLLRGQVVTVGDLTSRTEGSLLMIRHLGESTLSNIKGIMGIYGLSLAEEVGK